MAHRSRECEADLHLQRRRDQRIRLRAAIAKLSGLSHPLTVRGSVTSEDVREWRLNKNSCSFIAASAADTRLCNGMRNQSVRHRRGERNSMKGNRADSASYPSPKSCLFGITPNVTIAQELNMQTIYPTQGALPGALTQSDPTPACPEGHP